MIIHEILLVSSITLFAYKHFIYWLNKRSIANKMTESLILSVLLLGLLSKYIHVPVMYILISMSTFLLLLVVEKDQARIKNAMVFKLSIPLIMIGIYLFGKMSIETYFLVFSIYSSSLFFNKYSFQAEKIWRGKHMHRFLRAVCSLTYVLLMGGLVYIAVKNYVLAVQIVLIFISILTIGHVIAMEWTHKSAHSHVKKYRKTTLKDVDIALINSKIDTFLNQEKIYLNSQLNLEEFSKTLNLNKHQCSEFINRYKKCNVNEYINKFRINHAKQLLIDKPMLTTNSIGRKSGFNSPSRFNSVFKSFTGKSPHEFRRDSVGS